MGGVAVCNEFLPRGKVETRIVTLGPVWPFEGNQSAISSRAAGSTTFSSGLSENGLARSQRLKWSTAVKHYVNPAEVGKVSVMPAWLCRKRIASGLKSPNGVMVCRKTLDCWQGWLSGALERQSWVPGRTKHLARSSGVRWFLGMTHCASNLIPAFVDVPVRTTVNFRQMCRGIAGRCRETFTSRVVVFHSRSVRTSSSPTSDAAIPSFTCAVMALMRGSASATTLSCLSI